MVPHFDLEKRFRAATASPKNAVIKDPDETMRSAKAHRIITTVFKLRVI